MACFAVLGALLFPVIPAQADDDRKEQEVSEPNWIPSMEVGFEVFSYDVDTTILNLVNAPSWSGTQRESMNQLLFRIGGELMGPMFEDIPGRPRLFVQGGVGLGTFSDDRVFAIDNPDIDGEPEADIADYRINGPGTPPRDLPFDFAGQGSWLDVNIQDPSWYAGLGIAFSVPTSTGLLLYIKPSVQYSVEEIDFTGKMKTVYEPPPSGEDPLGGPYTRIFEIRESNADFSTTDHSVGPGLEVAFAFLSTRPVRVSIFGQVRFLWLVSDNKTSFTDTAGFATYSIERDDFVLRGGAGVRLSWVGWGAAD